jgi:hypothetical protein
MRNLTRSQRSALSNHPSNSRETKQVNLKYHRLRCEICRHASCHLIEEAFLQWRSPSVIMHCFGIKSETTIYHHAHAFQLFDLRDQGLRHALGNIIEEADTLRPTTRDVLRAIYALAHIDSEGQWVRPTNKSEVVVSNNRMPAAPSGPSTLASSHRDIGGQPSPDSVFDANSARSAEPNTIASETESKAGANL